MSEMVERVAKALALEERGQDVWEFMMNDRDSDGYLGKDIFRAMARAAIEAMREPTEAMKEYGDLIRSNGHPVGCVIRSNETDDIYRSMIDEALK